MKIHLMSQRDVDAQRLPAGQTQSVSPYLNPAHVLAPPRRWLEAVAGGAWVWEFFRLRYKNLLRSRYEAEPERFHALLEAADGGAGLVLTCHCLGERCHRELARDFLERLRLQRLQKPKPQRSVRHALRRLAPARDTGRGTAHAPNANLVLATLIEPPAAQTAGR